MSISKALGTLAAVRSGGRTISLDGGPVVVGKNVAGWLRELTHGPEGDAYAVRARLGGNLQHLTWRMEPSGWLRLDYRYWLPDREGHADHDYHGVHADPFFRYSIRVDGPFTPEFEQLLLKRYGRRP